MSKGHSTLGPKIPFISNLKKPTCASKRDVLELAILRYERHFFFMSTIPTLRSSLVVMDNNKDFNWDWEVPNQNRLQWDFLDLENKRWIHLLFLEIVNCHVVFFNQNSWKILMTWGLLKYYSPTVADGKFFVLVFFIL